MSMKNLADPESARKPVQPGQAAGSERAPGALARFAKLAGGGAVLMTTARFGRSPVRSAAYRLRERRPDLDLKLSWRLFANPHAFQALAAALEALPTAKRGQAQVSQAIRTVAQALQALAAKLSEAQASNALEPLLEQIGETTSPAALELLAIVLQALTPKLSEAQAMHAASVASTSLAWAADEREAAEWARALVTLSRPAADREQMLVNAITYPAAAGLATEVLLDAIRVGDPDAPAKEAGTEPALAWVAKTFPDVLRPPLCPKPLQPGLECRLSGRQQN